MKRALYVVAGWCWLTLAGGSAVAGDGPTNAVSIGVYDSRAVAYAHFVSPACQDELKKMVAAAKAAQQSGDTNKFKEYSASLKAMQDQNDRQVFSTAPVDEALAVIQARLPEIEKQAGVKALISKWDEASLKQYPQARVVDMTDKLVHEFIQPTAQQAQTIATLEKSKPISLEEADKMIREGKL